MIAAIDELRHEYNLKCLLYLAEKHGFGKIPRSTFFYSLKAIKKAETRDLALKDTICRLYNDKGFSNEKYGYRRICAELRKLPEYATVNHKKVQRLMHEMGLMGYISKNGSRYNSYKGTVGKIADNEVQRHFRAKKPNTLWSTDITEFKLKDGTKVYLSPIKDFCDGSIVSHACSTSPNMNLVHTMLEKALTNNICLAGLVFHSDQGWQYQQPSWRKRLESRCITQSMSRKGNCLDNSKMETFFSTIKKAIWFGHENEYSTPEQLFTRIDEYIRWYNEERIQVKLKGLPPLQFRKQAFKLIS